MPRNVAKADKTTRCIALLIALARAKRGIQLRPFFERRGWSWRSAYRDLATLRRAGVPIETRERGWFRVAEGWIPAGAIDVSHDELAALSAARRLSPVLPELDALRSKLLGPKQLALDLDAWLNTRAPSIDYDRHRLTLDVLKRAIRERLVVELHYRKATGEDSHRLVEPTFLRWEPSAETLYVVAWCRMRRAIRTFAVHRIMAVQPTEETFAIRRDAFDEMTTAFRSWARSSVEHVALQFSPRVAHEVRERRWHASATFSDTAEGGAHLEMDIAAPEELERLLLGYGPDVTVEAPTSLATRIRELHAACAGVDHLEMRRARGRTPPRRARVDTL